MIRATQQTTLKQREAAAANADREQQIKTETGERSEIRWEVANESSREGRAVAYCAQRCPPLLLPSHSCHIYFISAS